MENARGDVVTNQIWVFDRAEPLPGDGWEPNGC